MLHAHKSHAQPLLTSSPRPKKWHGPASWLTLSVSKYGKPHTTVGSGSFSHCDASFSNRCAAVTAAIPVGYLCSEKTTAKRMMQFDNLSRHSGHRFNCFHSTPTHTQRQRKAKEQLNSICRRTKTRCSDARLQQMQHDLLALQLLICPVDLTFHRPVHH